MAGIPRLSGPFCNRVSAAAARAALQPARGHPRRRPACRVVAVAALLAALAVLTAACGTGSAPGAGPDAASAPRAAAAGATTGGAIAETGSSLLYPLMRTWAAAYQRATPGVTVRTASTSSGAGIADASSGAASLGASDAYLSSGDVVKDPSLVNIPLAVSAQTVIYNLPGVSAADHVRLSGTVLAGMYDGAITQWDDPRITAINPGISLPPTAVVTVHRSDSSGDTFLFTSYLSTQDAQWDDKIGYGTTAAWPAAPRQRAAAGSLAVLAQCQATAGCVAYNGISYLSQARSGGLGEAALANSAGQYTLPDAASIQASVASFVSITPPSETISMIDGPGAGGYPIVNYEYAVVSTRQRGAAPASALRAFLSWVISTGNGARYLNPVGFQPLPGALVALGRQQIAEIGS